MIIRIVRAKAREGNAAEFKKIMLEQSIPWLASRDGLLAYYPGEPFDDGAREFVMVTVWRDLAALQAIAGDNWRRPLLADDEAPLVEELSAQHYKQFDRAEA